MAGSRVRDVDSDAWPAYAAVVERGGAAWLLRNNRAQLFMARTRKRVINWPDDTLAPGVSILYYPNTRTAVPTDFEVVRPGDRSLYGAFLLRNGVPRWIRVDPTLVMNPSDKWKPTFKPSPLATLGCDPELPKHYDLSKKMYPGCIWVVWTDPRPLDAATLRERDDAS